MAALTRSCYTNADPNKFRVCGLIGYLRWLVKLVVEWSFRHETMPHWVGDPVGRYSSLPDISRRVCHARRWQRRGHGTCKSARSNWNQNPLTVQFRIRDRANSTLNRSMNRLSLRYASMALFAASNAILAIAAGPSRGLSAARPTTALVFFEFGHEIIPASQAAHKTKPACAGFVPMGNIPQTRMAGTSPAMTTSLRY
jgi:hypothetical protein